MPAVVTTQQMINWLSALPEEDKQKPMVFVTLNDEILIAHTRPEIQLIDVTVDDECAEDSKKSVPHVAIFSAESE